MEGSNIPSIPYLMSTSTITRITADGTQTEYRRGKQGRPKRFADKYGQRLFVEDDARIADLGFEKNDFVRLAVHKFILDNYVHTELVNT